MDSHVPGSAFEGVVGCLVGVEWLLLKSFVSLDCHFADPLAGESNLCCYFLSVCLSVCLFFQVAKFSIPSLGYIGSKEKPGNSPLYCSSGSNVPT